MLSPDKILKELSDLWVTMGKPDAAEGVTDNGVLRACAMTLIAVVDESEDAMALGETLASLMRDHPSRAIVIRLKTEPDTLDCRVFAQCWMPFGHRRQICCEQVEITVSLNRLEDIPNIVAPLAVPDLPRIVWLRTRSLPESAAALALLALGDRIILDSERQGEGALTSLRGLLNRGLLVGDLAWTRTTEIRELLAQLLENRGNKPVESASIQYCGTKPSVEAQYLAGWLDGVLLQPKVSFESVADEGSIKKVRIEPGIHVELGGACADFQIGELRERASFRGGSDYELLNEELRITVHDRVFERVLRQIT